MAISVYPATPLPSWVYSGSGSYKTLISQMDSGIESRRSLLRFPIRTFDLTYKVLTLAERNTLHDFYRNMRGANTAFWFVDFFSRKWLDEYVGRSVLYNPTGAVADDGGVQTDETTAASNATANDMTLFPSSLAVNDAYYFGWLTQCPDVVRVNVGTAGAGTYTIAWEYYKGSWSAVANLTDGTSAFKTSGQNDVKFDKPTDATLTTVKSISAYWLRARITATGSGYSQPKGTQAWLGSRYYDLHGVSTSGLAIYFDGVLKTGGGTDYTFYTGGGEAGVDRIRTVSMAPIGTLITSDFSAYLRIKGRLKDDSFTEEMPAPNIFSLRLPITEVQW